ncbi:MAG: hypothetical protein II796_01735 [Oscillospiraceae bacterium]|nr:hypothetical protein [Oscillospiraceae bacterium]
MKLFRFEVKKQLKSILFWACIAWSIFMLFPCRQMFSLPFSSNEEAFEFMQNTPNEDGNVFRVKLSDIREEFLKKLYNKTNDKITINQFGEYFCYCNYLELLEANQIKDSEITLKDDVDKRIKDSLGNVRFSQVFFKILAVYFSRYLMFILMVLCSNLWQKDNAIKFKDLVRTSPIESHKYMLTKFMARFIPYIFIIFLNFIAVGVFEKIRLQAFSDFEFRLSDMFIPFLVFTVPPLLCEAMFCASVSILLKNQFFAGPIYLLLGQYTNLPLCMNEYDAVTGPRGEVGDICIPPVLLNYGLKEQIMLIIASIFLFVLACYIWNNPKKAHKERR